MSSNTLEVRRMSAVSNHKNHHWWVIYLDGGFYQGCWLTKREAVHELHLTKAAWRKVGEQ